MICLELDGSYPRSGIKYLESPLPVYDVFTELVQIMAVESGKKTRQYKKHNLPA